MAYKYKKTDGNRFGGNFSGVFMKKLIVLWPLISGDVGAVA